MSIAHNQGSAYGGSSSSTSLSSVASNGITIDVSEVRRKINDLMSSNFTRKKALKTIIRRVIAKARRNISKDARSVLTNDPRQAYKAVRSSVYKTILGGNVSILDARGGSVKTQAWNPQRTLRPGQRGGNRRTRNSRTEQIDSYIGTSRGFILRFLNAGTSVRETRFGSRGRLSNRDWFGISATFQMNAAVEELNELLDRAATELWNEG